MKFKLTSLIALALLVIVTIETTGCSSPATTTLDHYKQPAIDSMYSAIEKFIADRHDGAGTTFNGQDSDGKNLALNYSGGYSLSTIAIVNDGSENQPVYQVRIATDDSNDVIRFAISGPPNHSSEIITGEKDWFQMESETKKL